MKYVSSGHAYKTRDPYDSIRTKYGLTQDDWEVLLESQNGVCAICKNPKEDGSGIFRRDNRFRVDHDHETNRIRGLLCHKCNLGLHYVENSEWLSAAMEYLKEKTDGPEIKKLPDRRFKSKCPAGHDDNFGTNNRGDRFCRTCANERRRR